MKQNWYFLVNKHKVIEWIYIDYIEPIWYSSLNGSDLDVLSKNQIFNFLLSEGQDIELYVPEILKTDNNLWYFLNLIRKYLKENPSERVILRNISLFKNPKDLNLTWKSLNFCNVIKKILIDPNNIEVNTEIESNLHTNEAKEKFENIILSLSKGNKNISKFQERLSKAFNNSWNLFQKTVNLTNYSILVNWDTIVFQLELDWNKFEDKLKFEWHKININNIDFIKYSIGNWKITTI